MKVLLMQVPGDRLEARLRSLQPQWHWQFVDDPDKALQALHLEPADAVIVGLDVHADRGVELLARVRDHWPVTVRLVLSAQASQKALLQALPVAHQCLGYPFDPAQLLDLVLRSCLVQSQLYSPGVMAALGSIKSLPAVPALYRALAQELDSPHANAKAVAQIIEQDVSMTLRLLQLVNSAYFGLPRRITTIRDAVNYLGFEPIRSLVVSTQLFRAMSQICAPPGFSLEAIQQHSLRVACIAKSLLADAGLGREACSVAMLHDVGRVALAIGMPEAYAATLQLSEQQNLPLHQAEQRILNSTHAELGAHLLSLWGLPRCLVEAVAFHHRPSMLDARQLSVTGAIHIADAIDHHLVGLPGDRQAGSLARLDTEYLKDLGMTEQLPAWIAEQQGRRAA